MAAGGGQGRTPGPVKSFAGMPAEDRRSAFPGPSGAAFPTDSAGPAVRTSGRAQPTLPRSPSSKTATAVRLPPSARAYRAMTSPPGT